MKEDNVVREKSYAFAVRVVNVCRHLSEKKSEYVLSKQLLRSGTSVGANVEEAIGGQSQKDFFAKGLLRKTEYLIQGSARVTLLDSVTK